uniref:Uncharacterized protein n=1 Tax=Chromera velia CCMP2878 TaxID=1169474 RepID=A0A0G4H991_9ALVE|eukprot:Cvel_25343.t1-p1 / transcript=Cvel_25343.t1 / gene=Cvel_25343 / organism=Chromera_velia_CCMP2878 / gene_product=hypothetical protein / transcript_product=hypothetical protein / location=Cvel_scaffold2858:6261-11353(-) / protein_length=813 / sequence_SO=supercontig / SO=protein_coding / is_pseudo=false
MGAFCHSFRLCVSTNSLLMALAFTSTCREDFRAVCDAALRKLSSSSRLPSASQGPWFRVQKGLSASPTNVTPRPVMSKRGSEGRSLLSSVSVRVASVFSCNCSPSQRLAYFDVSRASALPGRQEIGSEGTGAAAAAAAAGQVQNRPGELVTCGASLFPSRCGGGFLTSAPVIGNKESEDEDEDEAAEGSRGPSLSPSRGQKRGLEGVASSSAAAAAAALSPARGQSGAASSAGAQIFASSWRVEGGASSSAAASGGGGDVDMGVLWEGEGGGSQETGVMEEEEGGMMGGVPVKEEGIEVPVKEEEGFDVPVKEEGEDEEEMPVEEWRQEARRLFFGGWEWKREFCRVLFVLNERCNGDYEDPVTYCEALINSDHLYSVGRAVESVLRGRLMRRLRSEATTGVPDPPHTSFLCKKLILTGEKGEDEKQVIIEHFKHLGGALICTTDPFGGAERRTLLVLPFRMARNNRRNFPRCEHVRFPPQTPETFLEDLDEASLSLSLPPSPKETEGLLNLLNLCQSVECRPHYNSVNLRISACLVPEVANAIEFPRVPFGEQPRGTSPPPSPTKKRQRGVEDSRANPEHAGLWPLQDEAVEFDQFIANIGAASTLSQSPDLMCDTVKEEDEVATGESGPGVLSTWKKLVGAGVIDLSSLTMTMGRGGPPRADILSPHWITVQVTFDLQWNLELMKPWTRERSSEVRQDGRAGEGEGGQPEVTIVCSETFNREHLYLPVRRLVTRVLARSSLASFASDEGFDDPIPEVIRPRVGGADRRGRGGAKAETLRPLGPFQRPHHWGVRQQCPAPHQPNSRRLQLHS